MATYNEYEDKETLIENPSIPDINKVKADDMNYIKYTLPHIGTSVDSSYRTNILKGNNLFDVSNIVIGKYVDNTTGQILSSNARVSSNYIPVEPNTDYIISNVSDLSTNGKGIAYYNANKEFISGAILSSLTGGKFTTPANCKYIYFSYDIASTQFGSIMLNEGTTALPYETYNRSIVVDNDEIYSKPVVLWQNSSPTSAFAGQQITLNDNIENYKWYEVIFEYSTSYNYSLSTGKINTNLKGLLIAPSSILQRRFISAISGTSMSFLNGQKITTYGGSATDDNTLCVPLQIIGYK